MNKKTKCLIVFLILLITAVVIFLCCTYAKSFDRVNNSSYANNETNTAVIENTIEDIENTTVENTTVEVIEEEPEEVEKEPEAEDEIVEEEDSELQDDNDEDKAIAIVKKDWGDTDEVAFKVEQINGDGSYVISVRNDESVALEWYTVYPKTGKFSK